MSRKVNTTKPDHKAEDSDKPAECAWQFVKTLPGAAFPAGIDQSQAVLVFRPAEPIKIGRPVEVETAITAKTKLLPAVVRYQPVREEIARLRELCRVERDQLRDAERRYEDATGDDSITDLAYAIDAARLNAQEAQQQLDRFAPIALKAFEQARKELVTFATAETNKFQAEARAAYEATAEEVLPQIAAVVTRLADAKCKQLVSTRILLPGLAASLIGEAPAAPAPAPQQQASSGMGEPTSYGDPTSRPATTSARPAYAEHMSLQGSDIPVTP